MMRRLRLPRTAPGWWLPRRSVRLRLTLLYGAVFVVSSAGLLAIPYALVASSNSTVQLFAKAQSAARSLAGPGGVASGVVRITGSSGPGALGPVGVSGEALLIQFGAGKKQPATPTSLREGIQADRTSVRTELLLDEGLALGGMAIISMGIGWLLAGRALRPVRTMTVRARRISERNLHERLAVSGPDDDLKELADTFDGLLGRLERAFEAHRRFVANASHELRTPLTLQRAAAEVALADPDASVDELRETLQRVVASGVAQERLIEALLTLARGQRGLERREPIDLGEVAAEAIAAVEPRGVEIRTALGRARTSGDRRLLERLIANLLDNATRYNLDGGWVLVRTEIERARVLLTVANSGPRIADEDVDQLLEPFRRGHDGPAEPSDRLGLGLSIVAAIVDAHGGTLTALARPDGGLEVGVELSAAPARPAAAAVEPARADTRAAPAPA